MGRKAFVLTGLLLSLCLSAQAFGQSTSARVSGTVEDASRALLPGVSVTATNNATGVATAVITNESGVYNLPSLVPGIYRVSAELPGFQTRTFTDVELGNAQQVRLNFTLQVATQAQSVEVTIAADTLLATSSSSVGEVLSEQKVANMPLVGNNVLDLFRLLPGARMNADGVNGTFAGVDANTPSSSAVKSARDIPRDTMPALVIQPRRAPRAVMHRWQPSRQPLSAPPTCRDLPARQQRETTSGCEIC